MIRNHGAVLLAAGVLLGCGGSTRRAVPGQPSPKPTNASGRLRAGFGRADITPPPGVGLAGNGPEGAMAMGQRLRLYARAMILEDAKGNRLGLVVADIPLGSALLHRRVAQLILDSTHIGVDRLIIAATHTHSGPSHYFEGKVYNEEGSSVPGYDTVMVDSLARRIQGALEGAAANLAPATIAWGSRAVWGYTRIRSLPAMIRNLPPPMARPDAPAGLAREYQLVDPEMSMLRVDQWDGSGFKPRGAFTIFAMHGTGNASGTVLLDGDIHGLVERRLERHIDSLIDPRPWPFVPRSLHLFANGTEGDVSPAWTPQSRCDTPTLAPLPFLEGAFAPTLWQWKPPSERHIAACVHAGRQGVDWIGEGVGRAAVELYDGLDPKAADDIELSRAFVTLPLRDTVRVPGICNTPAVGMGALVGADDAHTRMLGWSLFGVFAMGLDQGTPNPDPKGCQAGKHTLGDVLVGPLLVKPTADGFPSHAQVTVFQIGNRVIGTLPGEVTTTAGRRMRDGMLAAARSRGRGMPVDAALIMGLTNGYLEYITTAEEYTAQYYEGGSTLYGPGEAAMFGRTLAGLTASLSAGDPLPPEALLLMADPGAPHGFLHPRRPKERDAQPSVDPPTCRGDTLFARFRYGAVQDWADSTGSAGSLPRIAILRDKTVVAWDDNPLVELHLLHRRAYPARWELWWTPSVKGSYRVRVTGRPDAESSAVECGGMTVH